MFTARDVYRAPLPIRGVHPVTDDCAGKAFVEALLTGPRLNKTLKRLHISEVEIGRDHMLKLKTGMKLRFNPQEPEEDVMASMF